MPIDEPGLGVVNLRWNKVFNAEMLDFLFAFGGGASSWAVIMFMGSELVVFDFTSILLAPDVIGRLLGNGERRPVACVDCLSGEGFGSGSFCLSSDERAEDPEEYAESVFRSRDVGRST